MPLGRSGHIKARQIYQRGDGCYCDFTTDMAAEEGMSGGPVIFTQGKVLGILTLAGSGKFLGLSFGAHFEEAAGFLKAQGVTTTPDFPRALIPLPTKAR